jgi:spore maturation protein CgeB
MRGENLKAIMQDAAFEVVNIDEPIYKTNPFFRSLGWRYHRGPLLGNVAKFIKGKVSGYYDLVWIDKGVFIDAYVLDEIKGALKVHYTPDTGIVFNRSGAFFRSIPLYDYCITTKSFEMDAYREKGARQVLFCTQGYDTRIHRPYVPFDKKDGVVFVGHCEPARESVLARLLEGNIRVTLAGPHWERFASKYRNRRCLSYHGKGVYGEDYGKLLSGGMVGLGLLSKWFPERHTTRTLEIPACGTALATERNADTTGIFREGEAIFYADEKELIEKIKRALMDRAFLHTVTKRGHARVTNGAFDYISILHRLLREMYITKK